MSGERRELKQIHGQNVWVTMLPPAGPNRKRKPLGRTPRYQLPLRRQNNLYGEPVIDVIVTAVAPMTRETMVEDYRERNGGVDENLFFDPIKDQD